MVSPIDKIFEEIFGYAPSKAGTAFEQISAIASHIINGGDVQHDAKLRGKFSETLYQIDVHHKTKGSSSMGEVKDYTIKDKKVGRGDLQKLGGALPDLEEIDSGTFFSATGYTKPAQKYAAKADNIAGKPITLYGLRPSTELDEQGFIKTIVITMHIITPEPQKANWIPHITKNGQEALKVLLKDGEERIEYQFYLDNFYNSIGHQLLSLFELTSHGYGAINQETGKSHACFLLKNHYIKINGILTEIHGLEYEMPYDHYTKELRITDDSEHRFVLLDEQGGVIKFLTDQKLREYRFDKNGNLKKR